MAYRFPNLTCPHECNVDLPCGRAFANRIAAIEDSQRLKQLHRTAIQVPALRHLSKRWMRDAIACTSTIKKPLSNQSTC